MSSHLPTCVGEFDRANRRDLETKNDSARIDPSHYFKMGSETSPGSVFGTEKIRFPSVRILMTFSFRSEEGKADEAAVICASGYRDTVPLR